MLQTLTREHTPQKKTNNIKSKRITEMRKINITLIEGKNTQFGRERERL